MDDKKKKKLANNIIYSDRGKEWYITKSLIFLRKVVI